MRGITGQAEIDGYVGSWVELCLHLVNELTVDTRQGRPAGRDARLGTALATLAGTEPLRRHRLSTVDVDLLEAVARRLRAAVDACLAGDVHAAAAGINVVLAEHGAVPHLHAEPGGTPQLAFHAVGATIVDAWAAESATSLAVLLGARQAHRLGQCAADGCELYYLDATKNTSRRFCSLACQNRTKSALYRRKRRAV